MTTIRAEAAKRLKDWFASLKETPGKALAREVAAKWDAEGEAAAVRFFREQVAARGLRRWEQLAVADMVTAIRS